MIVINVRSNIDEVIRGLDQFGRDIAEQAARPALNKTIGKGNTEMRRAITAEYALGDSEVRAKLAVRRASGRAGGTMVAILEAFAGSRGKRSMNVIRFLEKKITLAEARRRRKGGTLNQLRFKIRRAAGAKTIDGAFIGNNGRTVFRRTGKARLPIEPVQVIDVPQMFNQRRINRRVVERLEREFPIEFERAVKMILHRRGLA